MSEVLETIKKTREYLNIIEEHYNNVQKAFKFITSMEFREEAEKKGYKFYYLENPDVLLQLKKDVVMHGMSKLSREEFVQYREAFCPTSYSKKKDLDDAWRYHKRRNIDRIGILAEAEVCDDNIHVTIVYAFIDWFAMSLRFGGKPLDYYRKDKESIEILPAFIDVMNEIEDVILSLPGPFFKMIQEV